VCCDDHNACTVDSCDPYIGCQNVKISCDDGDECTIDRCHCDEGCQHFPVSAEENAKCKDWKPEGCSSDADCEDGSKCTENSCNSGVCHTVAKDCNDNDLCTIDACHPDTGCSYTTVEGPCNTRDTKHEQESATAETGVLADAVADESNSVASTSPTLSVGAIAGIVVAAVLAVGIIAVLVALKSRGTATTPTSDDYRKM
jgi:hypothetical protein